MQPSTYFYSSVTVHCSEKGGKPDRTPYPLSYGFRNPYINFKPEISHDYAQEPQRNCAFINLASGCGSPKNHPTLLFLKKSVLKIETIILTCLIYICCVMFAFSFLEMGKLYILCVKSFQEERETSYISYI